MSWDAELTDDRGHTEGEWNYTHNTNRMINHAFADSSWAGTSWWRCLDGMTGSDGAAFLDRIIRSMESDPETFREMNPENGWGDYDSLLVVLREMRAAVPEWPTEWRVSG